LRYGKNTENAEIAGRAKHALGNTVMIVSTSRELFNAEIEKLSAPKAPEKISPILSEISREKSIPLDYAPIEKVNALTGERIQDSMQANIVSSNVEKAFSTNLEAQLGAGIYGTKAVVDLGQNAMAVSGKTGKDFAIAHSDMAGKMVARNDPASAARISSEIESLSYAGKPITELFGYQLQYDKVTGKIIGIQMDSDITRTQIVQMNSGRIAITKEMVEKADTLLLRKIDRNLLPEDIKIKHPAEFVREFSLAY
jgi:hypothetical protein